MLLLHEIFGITINILKDQIISMMVSHKHYLGSYIYLFRKGIKPIWEDKANVGGGSFVILAEKAKANKMW
jgi:hypothetical protein